MEQQSFNAADDLAIVASKNSSPNDFDFLAGNWRIQNRKLKTRLSNCQEWSNIDDFRAEFDGMPFEGMSLRLFDPKTKLWKIYWADSNAVVLETPVVGSFDGKIGKFYSREVFEEKGIILQFQWDKTNADVPTWSQAFSADNTRTWEWNWSMTFHRQV
jgi:hypothetical protein